MSNISQNDSESTENLEPKLRPNLPPWYRRKEIFQIVGAILILAFMFWSYSQIQTENQLLRHDNELVHSELNKLRLEIATKANKEASVSTKKPKNRLPTTKSGQNQNKKLRGGMFVPSRIDLAMLQDYAIEQDRIAIMADLETLASRAQAYFFRSATLAGGGKTFLGLTADSSGLAKLASVTFTDNPSGTYSIKTAGNPTRVVLHGVGKIALTNGTFPAYDLVVTSTGMIPSKVN